MLNLKQQTRSILVIGIKPSTEMIPIRTAAVNIPDVDTDGRESLNRLYTILTE